MLMQKAMSMLPDLNIIENVWGKIKYELRNKVFDNVEDLWSKVRELWLEISREFIDSLYNSIPRRIQAVIHQEGRNTKY